VMLGDAKLASDFARRLLDEGVYVIGFSYPVVPQGKARIRTQLSAAHTRDQLDPYERHLRKRFGVSRLARLLSHVVPDNVAVGLAPRLLEAPWFVRSVLLHRWFLHAHEPGIALAPA